MEKIFANHTQKGQNVHNSIANKYQFEKDKIIFIDRPSKKK